MGSIKDKTAIMGVGCTKFGELWEKDAEDMMEIGRASCRERV